MIYFPSCYDFYKLPEEERLLLVGSVFKQINRKNLFFPVQLAECEFNYGVQQGLIFITEIHSLQSGKWWRIGAMSPDDLDMNLDFKETSIRQDVIEYVKSMRKHNVTYRGVLEEIQKHFKAGLINF